MPSKLKLETSPTRNSETEVIVRKWLVYFGSQFAREITPLVVGTWCQLLKDLEPEKAELAFIKTAKTCRFFPTPADVRGQIDQAEATALQFRSEKEWERALKYAVRFYHPDLGISRHAPELPAIVAHAIAVAGGLSWLAGCPQNELQWARKRFLEAYVNFADLGQAENLLSDGEAKKILRSLVEKSPRQLSSGATNSENAGSANRRSPGSNGKRDV